jgi:hypothetical protein
VPACARGDAPRRRMRVRAQARTRIWNLRKSGASKSHCTIGKTGPKRRPYRAPKRLRRHVGTETTRKRPDETFRKPDETFHMRAEGRRRNETFHVDCVIFGVSDAAFFVHPGSEVGPAPARPELDRCPHVRQHRDSKNAFRAQRGSADPRLFDVDDRPTPALKNCQRSVALERTAR